MRPGLRTFLHTLPLTAAAAVFLWPLQAAHAQEATPPPPIEAPSATRSLTMTEALAYAHEHQPAIRAALARVSARAAQAKIPSGQWLPTVGITAQLFGM